jgi:hypothetical protein
MFDILNNGLNVFVKAALYHADVARADTLVDHRFFLLFKNEQEVPSAH